MKEAFKELIAKHDCHIGIRQMTGTGVCRVTYHWREADGGTRYAPERLEPVPAVLHQVFWAIMKTWGVKPCGVLVHHERGPEERKQDLVCPDEKTPAGRRWEKLMPCGIPRWVRIYDNGGTDVEGGTIDRYTAVYTGRAPAVKGPMGSEYPYFAMSGSPFHPQGFGQHGFTRNAPADSPNGKWAPAIGRKCHLGTRIKFEDLNEDCRRCIFEDYIAIWQLWPQR